MRPIILGGIAIVGAFAVINTVVHHIGPGVNAAITAWAVREELINQEALENERNASWEAGREAGIASEQKRQPANQIEHLVHL
jgi:hypothetical protein